MSVMQFSTALLRQLLLSSLSTQNSEGTEGQNLCTTIM